MEGSTVALRASGISSTLRSCVLPQPPGILDQPLEPVIGRAFARPVGTDPVAGDDGKETYRYPSPSSLANTPFTARAQPFSLRSRVAALMIGLKRCSSRQLSANFSGSGKTPAASPAR